MPTYEYHCKDCGYTFELNTSISEKEKKEKEESLACESCGSPNRATLRRLLDCDW